MATPSPAVRLLRDYVAIPSVNPMARADIDPLLDILNRRGFERELKRALAYVKRYGTQAADISVR